MLTAAIMVQLVLMIVVPIALAAVAVRKLHSTWRLIWIGAATFVASQAVRLPLLQGLTVLFAYGYLPAPPRDMSFGFNIAILALTAGLFEEGARWLAYRHVLRDERRWEDGVTFGLGHGAAEAILLGGLVLLGFISQSIEPGASPASTASYWTMPWHIPLLGGVERLLSICFHVSAAVLVLQCFVRGGLAWLWLAIALHAGLNAIAVLTHIYAGPIAAEVVIAVFVALCVAMTLALRRGRPQTVSSGP